MTVRSHAKRSDRDLRGFPTDDALPVSCPDRSWSSGRRLGRQGIEPSMSVRRAIMTKAHRLRIVTAGAAVAALGTAACTRAKADRHEPRARVERGKYLVTVGGCNDCHTPLKMGREGARTRLVTHAVGTPGVRCRSRARSSRRREKWLMTAAASGTAFSGPWGVSFAANLTPDQNTGLGIWTEEMFIKTVRTGTAHGRVARHPAADAVVQRRRDDRRRSESRSSRSCAASSRFTTTCRRRCPRRRRRSGPTRDEGGGIKDQDWRNSARAARVLTSQRVRLTLLRRAGAARRTVRA